MGLVRHQRSASVAIAAVFVIAAGGMLLSLSPGAPQAPRARVRSPALAADARGFCPFIAKGELGVKHTDEHPEVAGYKLLTSLILQTPTRENASLRRQAVMALGRLGGVNVTEFVATYADETIGDNDPGVRAATAEAMGLSFDGLPREPTLGASTVPPWDPNTFGEMARGLLETHVRGETDPAAAAAMLRAVARLPLDLIRAGVVESLLSQHLRGPAVKVVGALNGLELLARRAPKRAFGADVSARLRELAGGSLAEIYGERPATDVERERYAEALATLPRLAVEILHDSNNDDDNTLLQATHSADWQVRRLAALYLTPRDQTIAGELERLAGDPVFQVRAAALASLVPRMRVSLDCSRLVTALGDAAPAVVTTALEVAPATCTETNVIRAWMRRQAESLPQKRAGWYIPARALAALVRLQDPVARGFNVVASLHPAWQVRELAAELAEPLRDEITALQLAADTEPNVRAAALRTLTSLDSRKRGPLALENLKGGHGPLALAAASALPSQTPVEDARAAFEGALRAFSLQGPGTREVRLGLIARMSQFAVGDSDVLRTLTRDSDPIVAKAAATAFETLTGAHIEAAPQLQAPRMSPTFSPALPRFADILLADGTSIRIELLVDEAPVTVAWFVNGGASLQREFFDVSPGIGARAGDSRKNAIDGLGMMLRDELGAAAHTRGAVAVASNGYDAVNGQMFIDLIDRPDLDHGYTVFARIVSGLHIADRILPGTGVVVQLAR